MSSNKIVFLEQSKMPTHYYNIAAELTNSISTAAPSWNKRTGRTRRLISNFPDGFNYAGSFSGAIY